LRVQSIFKMRQIWDAHAISIHCPVSNQRPWTLDTKYLPGNLLVFNIHIWRSDLFVCKCISYFWSWMDVQPLWQVDMYQQNVFLRGRNQWRQQLLRMFGPESIRINEFVKTARSAVSKLCAVFFWRRQPRNLKNVILVAHQRVFLGFYGDIFGCSTPSKKRCSSTQEFTPFLSTV